ncbi:MAG TPA: hypothetical protein VH020_10240 [Stellaceae bacterium]|nr:hypothetical protein [Stellaceae bacterium]
MNWCDKLASTPTVGFTLSHHFASSDGVLSALSPILNAMLDNDEKPTFEVGIALPFGLTMTTEDGFQYNADASKISVAFVHRIRARPTSGGPPIMQMLSHPLPFTQLLPQVLERLVEATLNLPEAKKRTVKRVGIVTQTRATEEESPPGIRRFIRYVSRPWGTLDSYSFQITSELSKTDSWSDRCVHTITQPEDREELPSLVFDWQRSFSEGRQIAPDSLKEIIGHAQRSATNYFEELAEGNRFNDDNTDSAA